MGRILRWAGALAVLLVLVVLVVPLAVPFPAVSGTVPVKELADAGSLFADIGGLRVHYKSAGSGEPVMMLLHGFAASVFSWREVLAPLGAQGTVLAFDRPAFGLTSRPLPGQWLGESPYSVEAQAGLTIAMLDRLQARQGVLIGNSAGGAVAVFTALRYPDRVHALDRTGWRSWVRRRRAVGGVRSSPGPSPLGVRTLGVRPGTTRPVSRRRSGQATRRRCASTTGIALCGN
jgi:pimeloyl-ACP methyl ester carboxylesterase